MRVILRACGAWAGVRLVGTIWGAGNPADQKSRRRRASILVTDATRTILVDTSPDLREQLLDAGTGRLDAVLFTHAHADHLPGIDDLRSMNRLMRAAIPAYADAATLATIAERFAYVFRPLEEGVSFYKPTLTPQVIDGEFAVAGLRILPFAQDHGFSTTLGFRIGNM